MSEKQESIGKVEKQGDAVRALTEAVQYIRDPYLTFLAILGIAVLVALVVCVATGNMLPIVGFSLLVAVLVIYAVLGAVLWNREMKLRRAALELEHTELRLKQVEEQIQYCEITQEELKNALREIALKQQVKQASSPGVQIAYIEYDPPGSDTAGEFVAIENTGKNDVDIADWTLSDKDGHTFVFPRHILMAGSRIRVWTKAGADTPTDFYWGSRKAIWTNVGDSACLRNSSGALVDAYRYR